jgi:hypothetical protein
VVLQMLTLHVTVLFDVLAGSGVDNAAGASASRSASWCSPGPCNTAKDFVATIDATEGSPCFGKVVSTADVPTSGNEPHHAGLNINSTVRMTTEGRSCRLG